jgi:four helix bundle protein
MFNFEKLDVWQKAIDFADLVYSSTPDFPIEESFGLTNQMRRAAVSISSNIAEDSSRMSQVDFSRFVEIGAGSLFELVSQSFVARRQALPTEATSSLIYRDAEELSRMLSGLRKSLVATARN